MYGDNGIPRTDLLHRLKNGKREQTYPMTPLNPHPGGNMFNRVTKWMLRIVNRRICSVDEFRAILTKMENEAQYDADGFISIGELVKLLMKSFREVRLGKYD